MITYLSDGKGTLLRLIPVTLSTVHVSVSVPQSASPLGPNLRKQLGGCESQTLTRARINTRGSKVSLRAFMISLARRLSFALGGTHVAIRHVKMVSVSRRSLVL